MDPNQVNVQQDITHGGIWLVQFELAGSANEQFASYTASHVGLSLTITANDVVIESAVIRAKLMARRRSAAWMRSVRSNWLPTSNRVRCLPG